MPSRRQIQIAETISHSASEFIARESNRESLITVTRADVSPDLKHIKIFLSVLPEKYEEVALLFIKRRTTEFRNHLKTHTRLGHLPHIDFVIDSGEKNRQLIDELTRQ